MKPPYTVPVECVTKLVDAEAAVGDLPQRSELVKSSPSRPGWSRIYCSLWFGAWGAVAGAVWCVAVTLLHDRGLLWDVVSLAPMSFMRSGFGPAAITGAGGASALLLGAIFGPHIARRDITSNALIAIAQGIVIAALCALLIDISYFAYYLSGAGTVAGKVVVLPFRQILGGVATFWYYLIVWTGIVIFPASGLAAYLLYRKSGEPAGPSGCRVHGYREGGAE